MRACKIKGIKQKSMATIFKDLMITKRDFIDLREAIYQTSSKMCRISLNKNSKTKKSKSPKIKKQPYEKYQKYYCSAIPHYSNQAQTKLFTSCRFCCLQFPTFDKLNQHTQQRHKKWQKCDSKQNLNQRIYNQYYCKEERVSCERCGAQIKRKQIDHHHLLCCFNTCIKCQRRFYYKGINSHIESCTEIQKNQKIRRSLKPKRHNEISLMYPCSLMI